MATYYVDLPTDYLHLLNCICIYNVKKTYKCYNAGDTWRAAATRLTADAYSQVLDNFWTKPSYKRPYYYIHNINTSETVPTNPVDNINTWLKTGTDRSEFIDYSDPDIITTYNGKTFKFIDGTTTVEGTYLYQDSDDKESDYILDVNNEGDGTYIDPKPNKIYQTVVGELYEAKEYSKQVEGQPVKYYKWELKSSQDRSGNPIINTSDKNMFSSIDIYGIETSNIERAAQVRYGNASKVRLEIRYGTDNSVFTLDEIPGKKGGKIYIDYIKSPQHIRLTQEEIDYTEDKSQVLEFPDYVCQEILNELVHLVMENISDQRLQTHPIVSQSIANPTQQQAPEAAGQSAQ